MKTIITSALPYVNNIPHLGNMVCVLSADIYSRYLELQKKDKIFVLGTDEHGTTSEQRAIEEKTTPKKLVDKYFKIHTKCYDWFEIKPDCYGRTSEEKTHITAQEIFLDLDKNGFITEKESEEAYDSKEKKFLADRFVVGTCPHCKYDKADGDQCENCGKLLTPNELLNAKSKSGNPIEFVNTSHLYLDLPKLSKDLEQWINSVKGTWSENARTTTLSFIKSGLKQRAITRDLEWGVKVNKKNFENKVFYSWFDAPIGYIGITRSCRADWKDYWMNKENELIQFMGKDNIIFHTVMFPSYLIGTNKEWNLVNKLSVNEYLNYENGKFSKSKGTGVFCDDAMTSGISSCAYRYYLTSIRPEDSDTVFNWDEFQDKINSDLVGNYGNLVNRTLTFIDRYLAGTVVSDVFELEFDYSNVQTLLDNLQLKNSLKEIMSISQKANKYFQSKEPWKITDKKELNKIMFNLITTVKDLSILLWPFMPSASKKVWDMIGIKNPSWQDLGTKNSYKINKPTILFNKLETDAKDSLKSQFGTKDPFADIDLVLTKILEVNDHPQADKLYLLKLDVNKQIVAGIKPYYSKEELIGKNIVIVNNLKPAILRGEKSEGMLLACENKGIVRVLEGKGKSGSKVMVDTIKSEPKKEITIEQVLGLKLMVEAGKAQYNKKTLTCNGKAITCEVAQGKVR